MADHDRVSPAVILLDPAAAERVVAWAEMAISQVEGFATVLRLRLERLERRGWERSMVTAPAHVALAEADHLLRRLYATRKAAVEYSTRSSLPPAPSAPLQPWSAAALERRGQPIMHRVETFHQLLGEGPNAVRGCLQRGR